MGTDAGVGLMKKRGKGEERSKCSFDRRRRVL